MRFSEELQVKIKDLFQNNKEIREKLLAGDADTIREIGSKSQKGFEPEDIVAAFESGDKETIEYLYQQAKKMVELKNLYKDLCLAYSVERKKEMDVER